MSVSRLQICRTGPLVSNSLGSSHTAHRRDREMKGNPAVSGPLRSTADGVDQQPLARRLYRSHRVRVLRVALFVCGVGLLAYLIARVGTHALVLVLSRLAWWQFILICLPYGLIMAVDTLGWRYAFAGKPPPYLRMLAARTAGEALNIVTALGSVGGEAVKVWLLRPAVPYHESVPSIVLAKPPRPTAQTLFLLLGV